MRKSIGSFAVTALVTAFMTALTPIAAHSADGGGVAGGAGGAKATSSVATTGTCTMKKANFTASTLDFSTTTSATFVNIPEGLVSFTQGGSTSGCVIVDFSGMVFANAAGAALEYVRAVLNTGAVAVPFETQFNGDDDEDADGRWARSHAYTFVFPSVAPGAHTIQMQFRSLVAGQTVFMHRHTTVVYHQ
jgi:hypothetical protein